MPLDGDPRAAWATWDGDFEFRRTAYDHESTSGAFRALGGAMGGMLGERILRGSD